MSLWRAARRYRPTARTAELLVEEFGDEMLVYDQSNDRIHCLTATAWRVWGACDGKTTVDELAPALSLDPEVVHDALEQLEACELLGGGAGAGVTRREAAARLARIGAAAASAPLIYSIAAPTPALAASEATCEALGCGQTSTTCATAGCTVCQMKSCSGGSTSGSYCVAVCNTTNCSATTAKSKCSKTGCVCNPGTGTCTAIQCGA